MEEGILQKVMNNLDSELNGVREELSTTILSQVEGMLEGAKHEIAGAVK
jgi:hypothetical protein